MKIKIEFVNDEGLGVSIEGAGMALQEGCIAIYPDVRKGDATIYPLHQVRKIVVEEDEIEQAARKREEIRRMNSDKSLS